MIIVKTSMATLTKFDEYSIDKHIANLVKEFTPRYNFAQELAVNQAFYDIYIACQKSLISSTAMKKALNTLLKSHSISGVVGEFITIQSIEDCCDKKVLQEVLNNV